MAASKYKCFHLTERVLNIPCFTQFVQPDRYKVIAEFYLFHKQFHHFIMNQNWNSLNYSPSAFEVWMNVSGIENWRVILWAMFIVPCWIVINLIQCFKSNLLKSPQNTISRNCNWTFNDFSKLHIRTNTHKLEQMCQFPRFFYISRFNTEIRIPIHRKWLMTCTDSLHRWYKRGLCWGFNPDTIVCRSHFTYNGWDGSRLVAHEQAPILWKIIDNIEDPSIKSIRREQCKRAFSQTSVVDHIVGFSKYFQQNEGSLT